MNTIYTELRNNLAKVYTKEHILLEEFSFNTQKELENTLLEKFQPEILFLTQKNNTFDFWQHIQSSHNPLEWINKRTVENCTLISLDMRLEKILSALSLPNIAERNFNEGITLIFEENMRFFAVLAYKNNIYGAFQHNLKAMSTDLLKKNLEEFRFGWLPNEEALKQINEYNQNQAKTNAALPKVLPLENFGCILRNIPAEAEGFRPTFIICENKEHFPQIGRFAVMENTSEKILTLIS